MKFWEAMKALEEGKKVRLKTWGRKGFLDKERCGSLFMCPSLYYEEWEIYEEPIEACIEMLY